VFFFEQAMLPALDLEGRILLSAPDALFLAPNGHGGVLAALERSGGLRHAKQRGVETFSYFQVDNPLARPADPLFLGLHARARAQMSSKIVTKRDPGEKVGVIGRIDGKLSCIEYSDLPAELREARRADGGLVYGAGNIALHLVERRFVESLTGGEFELPWHVARKKMTVVDTADRAGRTIEVEGTKFETFVFDALQFCERSVTLEVERKSEFSPVKNASGEDSPATARADLCRLHAGWAERAGHALPPKGPDGLVPVEVDPVFAEDEDEFRARAGARPRVLANGHFYG
jgi:UDP-N-acetylglucosamine/UDP-N-acetylgalactosamine diphosphorylase